MICLNYSSAKDPVNMAGFMIENIESGIVKARLWTNLDKFAKRWKVRPLLDTVRKVRYARGHIDGFINIPVDRSRESFEA